MQPTTTLAVNPTILGYATQIEGWYAFISAAEYTDEQQGALVDALLAAQRAEFDSVLPDGCNWYPHTSEILGPLHTDLEIDLKEAMEEASERVLERFAAIERATLGA